jgi:hypothetical protein
MHIDRTVGDNFFNQVGFGNGSIGASNVVLILMSAVGQVNSFDDFGSRASMYFDEVRLGNIFQVAYPEDVTQSIGFGGGLKVE